MLSTNHVTYRLENLQPLLVREKVRLIVLDSAAAFPRSEFSSKEIMKREERIIQIASQLK